MSRFKAVKLYNALQDGGPIDLIQQFMSIQANFESTSLFDRELFSISAEKHFNWVAKNYLGQVVSTPHMIAALKWQTKYLPNVMKDFADRFASHDELLITDFGAGAGAVSSWALLSLLMRGEHKHTLKLTCIDISAEMKSATQNMKLNNLPTVLTSFLGGSAIKSIDLVNKCDYIVKDLSSDYANDDFADTLHDRCSRGQHAAVCAFTLHHLNLKSKFNAINSLYLSLSTGGIAIIVDEYRSFKQNQHYLRSLADEGIPYGLESFTDDESYTQMFIDCNFEILRHATLNKGRTLCFILLKK